ncbi:MAG: hypothetical protein QOF79_1932 [Actinomycetota bacterium]|nr:hypothetical protein [Actinomycetota bacterium]
MSLSTTNVRAQAPSRKPPSVHVRALITWIAIFPLVTVGFFAMAPFATSWSPVLRTFVLTIVVVPVAVYVVVPQLIRLYGKIRTTSPWPSRTALEEGR